ncbi:MAG: hypothetical protein LBD25_08365 [Coriobacteriales bacterium]|nr:hypothetical protein [Coriobacteriales bacterium]
MPQERSRVLPADGAPDAPTPDPLYGSYGNNRYLTSDPGFVDYAGGNAQLTQEAADSLGINWIDLSKIGARRDTVSEEPPEQPGLPEQPEQPEQPEPQVYPVLSSFGTWTGSGTASAHIDAPTAKFTGLATADGVRLGAGDYSVAEGSTAITLSEANHESLANGSYAYVARFTDGQSAEKALTVNVAAPSEGSPPPAIPNTGDKGGALLAFAIASALAGTAALGSFLLLRMRSHGASLYLRVFDINNNSSNNNLMSRQMRRPPSR